MVIIFCLLLILGIIAGQAFDFSGTREFLGLITSVCLAYIMIEVGLEFSVDKRKISSYKWDAVVAFSAAALPAILWFIYFFVFIQNAWKPALISGLSSSPTSAGVLFSMMMAAGLSTTWVFKKARTLAVLDDLVVILLLTPLEIVLHGFNLGSIMLLVLIAGFLFASFRWQNSISWPVDERWILVYAFILTGIIFLIKSTTNIHLEVLIPAFMLGCLILQRKHHQTTVHSKQFINLDTAIKGLFMFLVGISFPKISIGAVSVGETIGHVFVLTFLANLGKCFPVLCYRKEVPLKERFSLSIAMFPRGEVGAAVLLIGIGYGFGGYISTLAMLSLALNLVLTGIFVWFVMKLLKTNTKLDLY